MSREGEPYSPPSRRTLPYTDIGDQHAPRDGEPIEPYGMRRIEADIAEIKETLGRPPAPGRPGSGLVGAVMEMQGAIERLEERVQVARRPVSRQLVIAAIAALTGGGGIAGIIHAWRGGEPSPAQQHQTPGRTHDAHP